MGFCLPGPDRQQTLGREDFWQTSTSEQEQRPFACAVRNARPRWKPQAKLREQARGLLVFPGMPTPGPAAEPAPVSGAVLPQQRTGGTPADTGELTRPGN